MMKRKQFTLLEILIAVGVVLILAGITVGGLTMASDKGDEAKTTAVMQEFEMALEKFKADKGFYPVQGTAGVVDLDDDAWKKFNAGHYYAAKDSGKVKDGFDCPLFYKYPGTHNKTKYDLWSVGLDGKHGHDSQKSGEEYGDIDKAGEDGSDDICNWRQK